MKKLYLDNGYVNMDYLMDLPYPFIIVCGARGTGKTYGALKKVKEENIPFILMRRTQGETDLITSPEMSPFRAIPGEEIITKPLTKYNGVIYKGEDPTPIGYTMALSTISKVRGFSAAQVKYIIYDEFVPEKHVAKIRNEAEAFFNAYETINRNRELNGEDPVRAVLLSNSNNLFNPILTELGVIKDLAEMAKTGKELRLLPKRGIALVYLQHSPISDRKAKTALYKAVGETDFSEMAIHNSFGFDDHMVKSYPLKAITPVIQVQELVVYKIKGSHDYYASLHSSGSPRKISQEQFRLKWGDLWIKYITDHLWFEDAYSQGLFLKLIKP